MPEPFPPWPDQLSEILANQRAAAVQLASIERAQNSVDGVLTAILQKTDRILDILVRRTKPKKIVLALPKVTKKGKPMPNFELPNDEVVTITIQTTDSAGTVEPVPAGDVFTAVSSLPASLGATIGVDASGAPALILTPLVQASPGIIVTVSDSAGLVQAVQIVDIVADVADTNIILDVSAATHVSQPVPTAPGP